MDETALNDLLRKIRNTVKDFENEQSANGVTIRLGVDVKGNQITVKVISGIIADTSGVLSSLSDVYISYDDIVASGDELLAADDLAEATRNSTMDLPIDELLTPREQEDYRKRGRPIVNPKK